MAEKKALVGDDFWELTDDEVEQFEESQRPQYRVVMKASAMEVPSTHLMRICTPPGKGGIKLIKVSVGKEAFGTERGMAWYIAPEDEHEIMSMEVGPKHRLEDVDSSWSPSVVWRLPAWVWYDPKNAVGDFHVLEVNNRTYFRIMGIVDPEGIKEPDEDSAMETYLFRGSSNVGADIKLKVYYPEGATHERGRQNYQVDPANRSVQMTKAHLAAMNERKAEVKEALLSHDTKEDIRAWITSEADVDLDFEDEATPAKKTAPAKKKPVVEDDDDLVIDDDEGATILDDDEDPFADE